MTRNEQIRSGWCSFRRGLADMIIGSWYIFCNLCRELGKATNAAAHSAPWIFMAVEALLFISAYFVYLGQARAERDNASQTSYQYRESRDSLQILVDIYKPKYK